MAESIYNPYDEEPSGEACLSWQRTNAAQFWTAFSVALCGYVYMPFIKTAASNTYHPISGGAALVIELVLFAIAMLIDRRLFYSAATQRHFIATGAIYLFASYASYYMLGADYLEKSAVPWLTIAMASIHLRNSIVESRKCESQA